MRSHCCLCVCVSPVIVARQRLGKSSPIATRQRYRGNEYIRNNKRNVGRVVFNVARVVSRKVGD
jgi:hypothetical protein